MLEADEMLRRIDALIAKVRELEQKPPRERAPHAVATSRELAERVTEARTQYEALLSRAPGEDASMALLGAGKRSATSVEASLDPGEVLLEYFVTADRVFVFVVTPGGVRYLTSDVTESDLLERTRLARDLVSRPGSGERALPVLEALYDALMRPVVATGALRGARRLVVVRHSALTYLPFAALVDRDTHRYLVEDLPVLYVPSAAALTALRALGTASTRAGLVAPAVFAPFPDLLQGTAVEAQRFVRSFPGARSMIGAAATEGRLRAVMRDGAAVHVATHGVMNPRNPLFSRIELAASPRGATDDNGRLEVHELLNLRIESPLVFLSGCETGVGDAWSSPFRSGDDYTTLAQSLLFAGAANVVATLWRIDDSAAATLASHFYEHARTAPVPEALALAQRGMIHDAEVRAPYFWAAYEVTGGVRIHHTLQLTP
jgi:CHAT domain-containing protein